MITHDQDIDRRIIQEAMSLRKYGMEGTVICLAHEPHDSKEYRPFGLVHRIGLARIIPFCPAYFRYRKREKFINRLKIGRQLFHKLNWLLYGADRSIIYGMIGGFAPLPFDSAFISTGRQYPAGLVFAHDLTSLRAGYHLASLWGSKLIYDAHELYYEQKVFSSRQKKMMRRIEEKYIKKADTVFTVNSSIAEEMARRYNIKKPHVLLNLLAPPGENYSGSEQNGQSLLHRHFGFDNRTKIILYQGGLLENRNLPSLVLSMAYVKHPAAKLVLLGNGPLKNHLEKIADNRNLKERVFFRESVPPENLLAWSSGAEIGVIPYPAVDLNTALCTPNKLFEYILAGIPILANDLPELRRFVSGNSFGMNRPMDSPDAIARAIDEMLRDRKRLETFRTELAKRKNDFSWYAIEPYFIEIIKSVLER